MSADKFVECDSCKAKPGTPELCPDCLDRRSAVEHRKIIEITCPYCNCKDEYPDTHKVQKCTNCEHEMLLICPECNAGNPYQNTICGNCGKPMGRKFDEGKTDWTLAPWGAFEAIIQIMMFGAKKYARGNWKHIKPTHRYIAACYRHLNAWCDGESNDSETGKSHLWHAGCCIIFSIWLELKGELSPKDLDNE